MIPFNPFGFYCIMIWFSLFFVGFFIPFQLLLLLCQFIFCFVLDLTRIDRRKRNSKEALKSSTSGQFKNLPRQDSGEGSDFGDFFLSDRFSGPTWRDGFAKFREILLLAAGRSSRRWRQNTAEKVIFHPVLHRSADRFRQALVDGLKRFHLSSMLILCYVGQVDYDGLLVSGVGRLQPFNGPLHIGRVTVAGWQILCNKNPELFFHLTLFTPLFDSKIKMKIQKILKKFFNFFRNFKKNSKFQKNFKKFRKNFFKKMEKNGKMKKL